MFVLVSGLPGSGKTTLAHELAAALGLPLLCRDDIKETLWDTLGRGDVAWSRQLGAASAEVFFRIAGSLRPAVLETFFHRDQIPTLRAIGGPFVEVHCGCPGEVARQRYIARERHPCHFDLDYGVAQFDRWIATETGPLAIDGGPVLAIDTTDPVDLESVVAWTRAALASCELA